MIAALAFVGAIMLGFALLPGSDRTTLSILGWVALCAASAASAVVDAIRKDRR